MFGIWAKKSARNPNSPRRIHSDSLLFCCVLIIEIPGRHHNSLVPVLYWRGFNFGNRDFDRVLKIESNFISHYFACFGLLSTSTFENERNWLRVIGTLIICTSIDRITSIFTY